jgi:hypothetical protein
MKTAIIINGHVRTWEKCKSNFIEAFGDLNADLFISVYDKQYGYAKYIQSVQDFYEDNILEIDDVKNMFADLNIKHITVDNSVEMDRFKEEQRDKIKLIFNTEKHGPEIYESSFSQNYKLYNIKNNILAYEEANGFKYDRIIKTRTELIFNVEVLKRSINILENNDFLIDAGNIPPNDVAFFTSRDNAINVIDFMYNEFYNPVYPDESVAWPPHSILNSAIVHNNLNIVSRRLVIHVEREKLQQVY